MKGAKGEKVGFTQKKQFTQLSKVYASFFFLYCIIPSTYPGMPLFRSGPEFWRERVLKLIKSRSKFAWAFIFLYQLLFSLPWKKRCFVTLKKLVLEIQMTSNQKFCAHCTGEVLQPTNTLRLSLNSLLSIYPCSSKTSWSHVCILDVVFKQENNSLLYE